MRDLLAATSGVRLIPIKVKITRLCHVAIVVQQVVFETTRQLGIVWQLRWNGDLGSIS